MFEYVRKLTHLRSELEPLSRGTLINLYVSDQQYAYARKLRNSAAVVVIFNNDTKAASIEFDVEPAGLADGADLRDQLDLRPVVKVTDRRLQVTLPARSAAIFANQ